MTDELAARRAAKARRRAAGHRAHPVPSLQPDGRSVARWVAACDDCDWLGPARHDRSAADRDADLHADTAPREEDR